VDSAPTAEGTLELRRRGDSDFLITVDGRVLMNSSSHRSEAALGELACRDLRGRANPRVLVGGLGMGYTLRAILDALPGNGRVVVAELNPVVVEWCRGPVARLTGSAVRDPRVTVEIGDVAAAIRRFAEAPEGNRFDAIVLDLYEGPHAGSPKHDDPFYGRKALEMTRAALKPGGVFAVWGEDYDAGFAKRLRAAGFSVTRGRPGRGGYRHTVYVATTRTPRSANKTRP
jgi:spermidine synthase